MLAHLPMDFSTNMLHKITNVCRLQKRIFKLHTKFMVNCHLSNNTLINQRFVNPNIQSILHANLLYFTLIGCFYLHTFPHIVHCTHLI